MNIADFSVNRPVFITMVIVAMVLIGAILLPGLPVDLLPELNLPVAVVVTSYGGAAPAEIENLISKPIEDAVSTINNVDTVQSISQSGSSMVMIQFNWGTDMDKAQLDMQKQVDRIGDFLPDDANEPLVLTIDPNAFPVVMLGLTGDFPLEQLQNLAEDQVVPALERVEGVASASVAGGLQEEIQVVLDQSKLLEYGLTPGAVAQSLSGANLLATSGAVEQGDREIAIRFDAEMKSVEDVQAVQVALPTGSFVRLVDIAEVKQTFAEQSQYAYLNGEPVVQLQVLKATGGNTVAVSKGVEKALDGLKERLPEGVSVVPVFDQADFIQDSIDNLIEHGVMGGIIAVVILFLFLASWRTTLVVALMLPISIMATFTLVAVSGESINLLSLGGLMIGMGSLVDFAIVVIESIHRHRMNGSSAKEGAKIGTREVTAAVTASAMAQVVVFAPMLFAGGLAAELFAPMALTVIFSHIAAWFGAITFVPMLASRFLRDQEMSGSAEKEGRRARYNPLRLFGKGMEWLSERYRGILKWALGHRIWVIVGSFVIFIASLGLTPLIGAEFIPQSDQGQAQVNIELPPTTKLDETQKVVRQVEEVLLQLPEVDLVASSVGGTQDSAITGISSSNTATVMIILKSLDERERSVQEVLQEFEAKTSRIPGAEISASTEGMSAGPSGVQISIDGPDMDVLQEMNDQALALIEQVEGVANASSSLEASRPEVAVYIDRQAAAQYGISPAEIQSAVQMAFGGRTVTRVRDGENELNVRLMLPAVTQEEYTNLEQLTIRSAGGSLLSLRDVADVMVEGAPVAITRSAGQRQVQITVSLNGERPLGSVSADLQTAMNQLATPDGYSWKIGGETEQMQDSFNSLAIAIVLAIVLVYMIMAAQFESFFQPFVIMFCLPPTFVGALLGLATHGVAISVTALIGIIMLVGIVMNNAIVLVDYTNTLRGRGYGRDEALLEAGPVRLRPILMTMLTTNLVLVPFAYFGGESSETMRPLAIVVIYGLLVSTLITLVLVPAVYSLLDGFFGRIRRRLSGKKKAERQKTSIDTGENQAAATKPSV